MAELATTRWRGTGLPVYLSARTGYRPDIDGLRAVAVVPVVLFHAKLGPFTGGFVGVDVFFVISGFLITQLLLNDLEHGRFSLSRFYERRIRRLFPALFAMLCTATVCAALLFLPMDFQAFGRNVVGATLFVSNIFFWAQTNYFDGPAEMRPLLHTWSLAVEEQFYIFFPLLLVWLVRHGRDWSVLGIGTIALLSLTASVAMVAVQPETAFYLTPFRVWELLIGSLLALGAVPPIRTAVGREIAAALGLSAIFVAVLGYSRMTPFPGLAALLPCLGAALMIHAGSGGVTATGRVLASRPAVFVGAISYSFYLWHWPLFVFASYYLIHELSTGQSLALVAASFSFAALSWRFIEEPFRRTGSATGGAPLFATAGTAIACAAVAGSLIYAAGGLPDRFAREVDKLSSYALSLNPEMDRCGAVDLQLQFRSTCTIGDPLQATQMLWGDSHAGALFGAFERIAKENGPGTVYGASPRCPPLLGVGTSKSCIEANDRKLEYVLAHPEITHVVLAARWSLYVSGRAVDQGPAETNGNLPQLQSRDGRTLEQFTPAARHQFGMGLVHLVDALLHGGKQVVLVYPIPETGYDIPSTLARMSSQGEDARSFTIPLQGYLERQRFALAMLDSLGRRPGLKRVYPEKALCRGARCLTSLDSRPLYFDSHHLSIPGAQLMLSQLRPALNLSSAR